MSQKNEAYKKDLGNKDFRDNYDKIFKKKKPVVRKTKCKNICVTKDMPFTINDGCGGKMTLNKDSVIDWKHAGC